LFDLGQVVATPGALAVMQSAGVCPRALLARHVAGDWGTVDAEDALENARSVAAGWRIVSSYPVGEVTLWVITEADRSDTTFLLPEEY
jgi:hypothetical protein